MESIAGWAAPIVTIVAALMTAANLGSRVTGWGFGVFLIGSLLWTGIGVSNGDMGVIVQNVVLTLLNLFGMWRWLGRQAKLEDGGQAAHEKSADAASETLFPASLLTRADIASPDGKVLAKAVDAMVGCRTGRIAYLVAGEGGLAGVGERFRRIEWREASVDGDTIRVDHANLGALPELEKDNWPGR